MYNFSLGLSSWFELSKVEITGVDCTCGSRHDMRIPLKQGLTGLEQGVSLKPTFQQGDLFCRNVGFGDIPCLTTVNHFMPPSSCEPPSCFGFPYLPTFTILSWNSRFWKLVYGCHIGTNKFTFICSQFRVKFSFWKLQRSIPDECFSPIFRICWINRTYPC